MNTIKILLLLLITAFMGCSGDNPPSAALSERVPAKPENSDDLFVLSEQLRFIPDSVGRESYYYQPIVYEGKNCLGMLNTIINGIDVYSIEDSDSVQLVERVVFEQEGAQGVGSLHGFDWVSKDSIFLVSSPHYGNVVSLGNHEGRRIRVIKRKAMGKNFRLDVSSSARMYFYQGKLYFMRNNPLYLNKERREEVRESGRVEEVIDAETGASLEFDTPFSDKALEVYHIYYRNMGADHSMVYSCRYDHYLYTKDMEGIGESGYDTRHLAKSRFIGPIYSSGTDGVAPTFWEQKMGCYFGVFYDPYRQIYYRFAYPGLDYTTDPITGERPDRTYEVPFSVIVLDKDFNILGEQLFPPKVYRTYFTHHLFIGPKGLYLSLNNPFNVSLKEDEIAFQLLQLKPEVLEGMRE